MAIDETAHPDDIAEQIALVVGRALEEHDRLGRALGISLEAIRPGRARLVMTVRDDMLNGHGTCHGGITYSLAQTAITYASCSHNRRIATEACDISYAAPARPGEQLIADARERTRAKRTGIYDVSVYTRAGETIALVRGHVRLLDREVVAGLTVAV